MQNWEAMQPNAHFDQHNSWYNSMFAAQIKTEPGTTPPPPAQPPSQAQTTVNATPTTSQLEHYLNMKQQQHQHQHQHNAMDTMSAMTPSPSNNDSLQHHFYDSNMQQQLLQHQQQQQQQQQQQYQQQFQAAQQAAAQQSQAAQMPLGFNPLTPPGLPSAVLPPMPHFYGSHTNMRPTQHQTPSPQPGAQLHLTNTPLDSVEKMPTALTPRNTPPMDVTPPKSPKSLSGLPPQQEQEKDQDLMSNSSEDMKYMAESEDDESIRMPIYNSHGKMKNYKCKTCGLVAITKIAFWEHARSHMKPEKILQCPKCPFVTELKHHLEYHIRKHKNLKPFQCDKCSYSCVNKSMLNSHRKSHSSVYQYRCADCDYATKYCHSFKLHLRKYDHKPGMVLDEEGIPNPSVVIDVYGTRRGPKSKSGSSSGGSGSSSKRNNSASNAVERLTSANLSAQTNNGSQLSAALQGFPMPQHQMPASPAKSCSSTASELPTQPPKKQQSAPQSAQQQMPNLLSTIMQQNHNMAFFPYWNLNLQMLAAQQQAAVLAQLSPRMRETAMQQLQGQQQDNDVIQSDEEDDNEEEEDAEFDRKSVDSAMDLSQGTPTKEEEEQQQQTPAVAMNLKLPEEVVNSNETPIMSSVANTSRRKGRVLKLDTLLQGKAASLSPEQPKNSSTGSGSEPQISDAPSSADESMETSSAAPAATSTPPAANTSASSTASSSGNSSNSSSTSSSGNPNGAIYECKYCDIYFKDAVLYTIHMGYHSCDDVFKCNMCGEKCDGPVGLFVHMARNAHS